MPRLPGREPANDREWVELRATDLFGLDAGDRIRVATTHKHGQEYEAVLVDVEPQDSPAGWVRVTHRRDGFDADTINVLPPDTPCAALLELRTAQLVREIDRHS